MADSRTGKRFPLALPITIKPKKTGKSASGTTADVSAAGVFIQASASLDVGAMIEFDITLPGKIVGSNHNVEISCKGRVVRMEAGKGKKKGKQGVACVIDHYKFIRGKPERK